MKKRVFFVILTCLLVLCCLFTSCGSNGYEGSSILYSKTSSTDSLLQTDSNTNTQKLVYRATVNMETTKYDDFMTKLRANLTTYGAYCSSERLDNEGQLRDASIVIRVPVANFNAFLSSLSADESSKITSQTSTVEEVTLTYATLKARSDTLGEEITTLTALLTTATTVAETQNLSESIYDLKCEKNETDAKLAVYDDLVAFSTINLYVDEVKVYTEPEKEGAFIRIGKNLATNFSDIGNGFVEFFVFIVSALPYLALFGGIGVGIYFIIRASKKRKATPPEKKDK